MGRVKKNIMDLATFSVENVSECHLVFNSQVSHRLTISEQLILGDLPGKESALYIAFSKPLESL